MQPRLISFFFVLFCFGNAPKQPYKECAAFVEHQENLADSDSELEKFYESRTFQNVIKEVSRRLRFEKKLKRHDIIKMYDMCRYEQAWNKNVTSIWCLVSVIQYVVRIWNCLVN